MAVGDLYWPHGAEAALVLVPGVVPEGKDDPRLVELAQTLVRARFAVLVPDIANLRAQKVSPEDARAIAAAIAWLARCTEPGEAPSVGVMAISYAAGPAILAALRPDAAPRVRFLVAIGGYYDLEAVVTFFTTGYFRTRARAALAAGRAERLWQMGVHRRERARGWTIRAIAPRSPPWPSASSRIWTPTSPTSRPGSARRAAR